MEVQSRRQAVIRLKPETMIRAKYKAKQQGMSFNSFIESVVEEAVKPVIPKLPKDFKIDPVIASFAGIIPAPTQEELDADPRLAHIMRV